jgi:sterol 3beta-glucosyltransferase
MLLTVGTRGDVQPLIALGKGLKAAGFHPVLAAETRFAEQAQQHGIDHCPITARMMEITSTAAGAQIIAGQNNKLAMLKQVVPMMKQIMPMLREMLDSIAAAAQQIQPQAIVFHPKSMAGASLAEKYNMPAFIGFGIPALTPTREFPNMLFTTKSLGLLNRATYSLFNISSIAPYRRMINTWRREKLGLSNSKAEFAPPAIPMLYHYSTHVAPRPADWDANNFVTGYWFLDEMGAWQPPDDLQTFLESGEPPVYIGFGSMPAEDAEAKTRIVMDAVQKSGKRAVIAAGWGGLKATSNGNIFALDAAPHDWLFPRMSAVVHHGGAGTTAAGLRAGKPTVICPFFGDQPYWGERMRVLGAGPAPLPQRKLNADDLAKAITEATMNTAMRDKAEALGAAIRAEDGVCKAVEIIQARLK